MTDLDIALTKSRLQRLTRNHEYSRVPVDRRLLKQALDLIECLEEKGMKVAQIKELVTEKEMAQ